jgi:hypothetical protein
LSELDSNNILCSVTVLQKGKYEAIPEIDPITGKYKLNSDNESEYTYNNRVLSSARAGDPNGSSCAAVDGSYIKKGV